MDFTTTIELAKRRLQRQELAVAQTKELIALLEKSTKKSEPSHSESIAF